MQDKYTESRKEERLMAEGVIQALVRCILMGHSMSNQQMFFTHTLGFFSNLTQLKKLSTY